MDLVNRLNLSLKETKLNILTQNEWNEFSELEGLYKDTLGWYSPSRLQAYVNLNIDKKIIERVILHEYFGHGLFFEKHPIGNMLHNLSKELKDEEWRIFNTMIGRRELKLPKNESGYLITRYSLNVFYVHFKNEIESIAEKSVKKIMESELL